MPKPLFFLLVLLPLWAGTQGAAIAADKVVVGSKRFTESYILGEIVRQTLVRSGVEAEHKQGLGNTGILDQALSSGAVDVYPEYTGTIVGELLKRDLAQDGQASLAQINQWLAPRGLKAVVPLGFNNTYALAMLREQGRGAGREEHLRPGAVARRGAQARPVA